MNPADRFTSAGAGIGGVASAYEQNSPVSANKAQIGKYFQEVLNGRMTPEEAAIREQVEMGQTQAQPMPQAQPMTPPMAQGMPPPPDNMVMQAGYNPPPQVQPPPQRQPIMHKEAPMQSPGASAHPAVQQAYQQSQGMSGGMMPPGGTMNMSQQGMSAPRTQIDPLKLNFDGMSNREFAEVMPMITQAANQKTSLSLNDRMTLEAFKQKNMNARNDADNKTIMDKTQAQVEARAKIEADKLGLSKEQFDRKMELEWAKLKQKYDAMDKSYERALQTAYISKGNTDQVQAGKLLQDELRMLSQSISEIDSSINLTADPQLRKDKEKYKAKLEARREALEPMYRAMEDKAIRGGGVQPTTEIKTDGKVQSKQGGKKTVTPTGRTKTDANGVVWEEMSDGSARKKGSK